MLEAHLRITGFNTDTTFNADYLRLDIDTDGIGLFDDSSGVPLASAVLSTTDNTPYLIHAHLSGPNVIVRRGQLGQPLETVLVADNAPIQATDRFILSTGSACLVDDVNIGHYGTEYAYDALGRRIEKRAGGDAVRYIYDGARVAEEWAIPGGGGPALAASYVYGLYVDEVLTMRRGGNDYYYHGDDMHNVVKLTDSDGDVVEAYDYGDYGQPEFYDATGDPLDATESAFGNPFLFSGREWDAELGFYYFRNRYMDPGLGRFVSRDPLGLWGDPLNLGNGYTYAASNPWSLVDPFGLCGGNIVERFLSWAGDKLMDWADGRYEDSLERARSSDTQVEGGIDYNRLIDGSAENFSSADVLGDAISQAQEEGTEGAMEAGKFVLKEGVLQAVGGGIGKLGKLGKVVDDIDPRSAKRLDYVVDAEVAAQEALTALQGSIKGGHFLTRHSPATTLEQQYLRATKGLLPDGSQGRATNASRFFNYVDMNEAINKAISSYQASGGKGRYSVAIDMLRDVGEGYYRGTGVYARTRQVMVHFNELGQPITAFPLLPKKL